MSVLIYVQTVCISYQQMTKVSAGKERVKEVLVYTVNSEISVRILFLRIVLKDIFAM